VALNVPVRVHILRVVFLLAGDLNLFETPLRQIDVGSAEVASKDLVLEPEPGSQRVDPVNLVSTLDVIDHLDHPVILFISNGSVSITGHFVGRLCYWCRDGMRVEVTGGRCVLEANYITILEVAKFTIGIIFRLIPSRKNVPIVVLVLVVVAGDLLLIRANWEGLHVRVQKTTTVADILQCDLRSNGYI
jgi:uncharacterized membrane protein (UPF0136 family)